LIFQSAFKFLLEVAQKIAFRIVFVNIVDMDEITTSSRDDSKEDWVQNQQPNSGFFGALGPDIRREFYRWALLVQEPTELSPGRCDQCNEFGCHGAVSKELVLDFSNVNCPRVFLYAK
jgi:hypothetical protein